jgi:Flp pilus assembly protein TadD
MSYAAAMKFRAIPLFAAILLAAPAGFSAPQTPVQASIPVKAAAKARKPQPPVTVESLLADSRAADSRGQTELALRLAQAAIVADPARPASYVALGDIYARAGQDEFARSYYQAALGIDPVDAGAVSALAALDKPRNTASANAAQ